MNEIIDNKMINQIKSLLDNSRKKLHLKSIQQFLLLTGKSVKQ